MRALRAWLSRFGGLFGRQRRDRELADEMESHLQMHIEDNLARGMTPAEARRQALIKLGGVEQTKETYRERRGLPVLDTLLQDIRFGFRMLRKSPGFTAVAVITLALGIGANTAIFSLFDGLVLRALPVPHPEQIVRFGAHAPNDPYTALSLPMFEEITRDQRVFSGTFAWGGGGLMNVQTNGELSRAMVNPVAGNFYSELGATPQIGRLIEPGDVNLNAPAPEQVAVLSYGFWQRQYGGDKSVVGKTLRIQDLPFTIIGVTRDEFTGMNADTEDDITVPLTAEPIITGDADVQKHLQRRDVLWLFGAGRLKSGVTLDQARAQLDSLWPAIRQAVMPLQPMAVQRAYSLSLQLKVESGATGSSFLRTMAAKPVYIVLSISGLVLLIACVNLASLMLSRTVARNHEFGVRMALGASGSRLARQVLVESVMLSIGGTLAGFAFANWGSHVLASFLFREYYRDLVPIGFRVSPDWRVLGFTAAVAIFAGVLFGLAPAWRAGRDNPNAALQQSSRTLGRGTGRLGKALIVTQVALSLMLLAGAGLFIRTLEKLRAVQPGFRIAGVLDVGLFSKPNAFKNVDRVSYFRDITDRASHLPGVTSAAVVHDTPGNLLEWKEKIRMHGLNSEDFSSDCEMAMPGFFRTENISILQGRTFTWNDGPKAPPVAVVSENFAKEVFPRGNAIGQRIDITTEPKWQNLQIIGIVSNAALYDMRRPPQPTVYLPTLQYGDWADDDDLLVQTNISLPAAVAAIRPVVDSLGRQSVLLVSSVAQDVDLSILQERITAMLSAFFGALALLLAAIGLYGLMAYTVTRRTRELGIRFALGAQRNGILKMVLVETLKLTLIGIVVGLPCALAATRLIAHMLFGVTPYDPVTLAAVSFALLAVGALAGYIPARRAMRVDPMVALRHE